MTSQKIRDMSAKSGSINTQQLTRGDKIGTSMAENYLKLN